MDKSALNQLAPIILKHWCSTWCVECVVLLAGDLSKAGFREEAQKMNDLSYARAWIARTLAEYSL